MAPKISKNIIFYLSLLLICFFISCSNDQKAQELSVDIDQNPPSGLPPGIPSYPYIFEGTFYLNGEKVINNLRIKSMLGELDSPEVITNDSEFKNLIIGPRNTEDIKNNIEFYLILENGDIIKAKEEIPFEVTNKITTKQINLNFEK
tara:strand:+ start:393 stop:833 length:441 start_codon:yes stop_codon:yes gene_type:complete